MTIRFRNSLLAAVFGMWLLLMAKAAFADPRHVEKLRNFYRDHNMDFFGELIADQQSMMSDEKRHAKIELLADDARTKALDQLQRLLRSATGPMRAELLMRRATLFADRARTATYFQNNPFKTSRLKSPKTYLEESIKTFKIVEASFPSYPKMDVVLFSIGYNFGELKDQDRALTYYLKVIAKHADSELVGDAHLAASEIYFDKRKFGDSLKQLDAIVKAEHPRLKNFALYKMAWTYYNMSALGMAMSSLERVIDGVNAASAAGVQTARLELRKEALHDLVGFYAEQPGTDAAQKAAVYFEKMAHTPDTIASEYTAMREKRIVTYRTKKMQIPVEDDDAWILSEPKEMLLRLTQVYKDQGKHANAMTVAELLLADLERHPKVPSLYRLRAECAEKMRRRDLMLTELKRLAEAVEHDLPAIGSYSDGLPSTEISSMTDYFAAAELKVREIASPRVKLSTLPKVTLEYEKVYQRELARIAFDVFKDFSGFLHGEWSKTQDAETARLALAVYDIGVRALLSPWRGHPLDPLVEIRARRGQLRFAAKQYDLAAQDFRWLTLHPAKSDDASSLKGEIASLEAMLKSGAKLTDLRPRLIEAYDLYLALRLTQKKDRGEIADILAASARLEGSLTRMMFYSAHFHDQKDGAGMTQDILALLEKGSRWEELRNFSEAILDFGHFKKSPLEKELSRSNEYASLKLLEKLESEKDWKKAAKEFAHFAKKNPGSSFVSQALMKSANAALQMKDVELAIDRLEEATHAPDESVRTQAWQGLEPFYRKSFQWKKLISLYTSIKNKTGARQNLATLAELDATKYSGPIEDLISNDKELTSTMALLEKFDASSREFKNLRFVKSNNNPQQNFKKKADLHSKLTVALDRLVDQTPKSFKGATTVWANVVRSELLLEFAETLDRAALPAVLAQATEADRKAYIEAIASQSKELRENARSLAQDSLRLVVKVDHPFDIEERLNALLRTFGEKNRVRFASIGAVWAERPQHDIKRKAWDESAAREITELGLSILKSDSTDDQRQKSQELARQYLAVGEPGYAYAIASALGTSEAKRLQYEIDSRRLPTRLTNALRTEKMTAADRWDLGRWCASQAKLSDVFSSDEQEWFNRAARTLLRAETFEGVDVESRSQLSQN